ncbi:hypothetical protein HHK36_007100 [Tetracentron sinense]|uniref:Protein NLRC3 n=2 Tax=Magnoliopsida TaxID=3398 RepID=A0A834ZIA6_TETSI|nr:hypothetical protein HHK36_007100 [Tetracentron sinense]
MASTSTFSLPTHAKIAFPEYSCKHGLKNQVFGASCSGYCARGVLFPISTPLIRSRRIFSLKSLIPMAASRPDGGSSRGTGGRRVYKQSQGERSLPRIPVNEIASFAIPAGVFVTVTFVLWKLVEKLLVPKPMSPSSGENKSSFPGMKWSFAAGTNLSSGVGLKIDRDSKQKLNEFAKELKSFRSVDMSGRNFGDGGLFFLAESLRYNQSAEEVDFSANGITAAGLKAFDGVLQSNIVLKTLNLSGNPIGDEGAKCLCDILVENASIQKLQLNSSGLGDEGAKAIAEILKKSSSLRVLELNNNMIDYSGFTSLAGALLENKTIRSIYLNGNYGGALGAAALAKGIEGNKSLRELHLHGNSIGNEGIRALMSGLSAHKGKITLLDIGNNEIGSKGAFHVAEFIKKSKSLLWLNLYMNDIGDEGAEKIADALKENRSITTVDLGGNNIHAKGVSNIARVLKDNSVITTLELGYNPIGPDGAKALAEVLKFHGKIETLKLGWCQIGAKGAEFIADTLKYNTTISTLDLRANGLGDDVGAVDNDVGAVCLARSLKVVNEALTSLDLGFNEIRDRGAFAIAQAFKANEDVAVTSLNLASNFLTKYGQSALTDARDHVYEMILVCPTQGHINPLLQFAKHLASKGLKATIATTHYTVNSINAPGVTVEPISDGYDEGGLVEAADAKVYRERFRAAGSRSLAELIQKLHNSSYPVNCVVYDSFLPWALDVAKQHGVHGAAFFTTSAAVSYIYYQVYHAMLTLPVMPEAAVVTVPGFPPMRRSDFPSFLTSPMSYPAYLEAVMDQFSNLEMADWVLGNTFQDLESEVSASNLITCIVISSVYVG